MYRKTPHTDKSSGQTHKTPGSPHSTDIGAQAPSLGRSLFMIDKSGDRGNTSKKTPKSKPNGEQKSGGGGKSGTNASDAIVVLSEENNEMVKKSRGNSDFFDESVPSSPMSVITEEGKTPITDKKKGIEDLTFKFALLFIFLLKEKSDNLYLYINIS